MDNNSLPIPVSNDLPQVRPYAYHFFFEERALIPDQDNPPTWADCNEVKILLTRASHLSQLWLGDLLNYMEARWHDEYLQAVDESDYAINSLHQYQWVARKVPSENRLPELSYKHFEKVAGVPPEIQRTWLERAKLKGWTAHEMEVKMQVAGLKEVRPTLIEALIEQVSQWRKEEKKTFHRCADDLEAIIERYSNKMTF